jgi:hypothetical protein
MTDADTVVADFLKNFWGTSTLLSDDADILDRLGIDGGDAFDLIERFATKFEIDITNYHWYFHHGEEVSVNTIGSWFFKAPYRRVDRIPITSQVLAEAIRTKRWPLEYPEHKLPSVRWDIRFSQAVSLAIAAVLFGWGLSFRSIMVTNRRASPKPLANYKSVFKDAKARVPTGTNWQLVVSLVQAGICTSGLSWRRQSCLVSANAVVTQIDRKTASGNRRNMCPPIDLRAPQRSP